MISTRFRSTILSTAGAVIVLALATGCGGGTAQDQAPTSEAPAGEQRTAGADDAADSPAGASDDVSAADDSAADDSAADDAGASDGGGAGADGSAGAKALAEDADLAAEELPITAEDAIGIATETAGGGELTQIEIDHDDRSWEGEIEIVQDGTQHELDIDATTGEVTEHEQDGDEDQDPTVDVTAPMTSADAIEIALGAEPGRVSGWDLSSDDDRIRYQIDIDRSEGGDVEVDVDVETGEVGVDD